MDTAQLVLTENAGNQANQNLWPLAIGAAVLIVLLFVAFRKKG